MEIFVLRNRDTGILTKRIFTSRGALTSSIKYGYTPKEGPYDVLTFALTPEQATQVQAVNEYLDSRPSGRH